MQASFEDLACIKDVGNIIAKSVYEFFKDEKNETSKMAPHIKGTVLGRINKILDVEKIEFVDRSVTGFWEQKSKA